VLFTASPTRAKAWLCFLDESAVSLTPPVRRTWAPRGVTPVLRDRKRHRPKVSRVGALCFRPDGSAARLLFGFHRGSYDAATLVEALTGCTPSSVARRST
jgi:hypothetical protein